jgi:ribosomal protein S18 acetylase RimI-like enzyme
VLATLPDFRLRGIGSSLVRHGLAEAEALGLSDLWLTASADGHDLYMKYGFQDLESVFTHEDIAKYGGSGDPKVMAMGRLG